MRLLSFEKTLKNKKILVTGHTGFTGGWACLWLKEMGAEIAGYALQPETTPALFDVLNLSNQVPTVFGDICDFSAFLNAVETFQPELILHLAAQPLVRRSYDEPVKTFAVNSQGTVHVLEAARLVKSVKAVLCVTTDKVYKNNEWDWPYREGDVLGGKDPYSASKSAAEMVIQSYRASYPWSENKGPAIATARGGNIIGGGDWSEDRLIPDFVSAVTNQTAITLRYPDATRPWQHVLALVHGYFILLAGLVSDDPEFYAKAWNFGPADAARYSVRDVFELMSTHWQRPQINYLSEPLPEASALALDSSMARTHLDWRPVWDTQQVILETVNWYKNYYVQPDEMVEFTTKQINAWRESVIN